MKRLICILICLILLAGCGKPPVETTLPPETTVPVETTQPAVVSPEVLELREILPVMDGSTSLIPLEAGVRAAIFGISMEEATAQVVHSSTWSSFYNLLSGTAELIFSCPLSEEQYAMAQEQGVELETVPVAMEGFVFVVNADNPVDTLTQAELRGIYSGEITNWKELGGEDREIIPYQRNSDSGSQNYMVEFMGDVPLMEAPKEMRPATMEGLMDVIAINDNAPGAIGYSVYAYAADMYGGGDDIKFIRVDGVAPDKQTMAAGEYPLLGKNYAVFNAAQAEDSPVRKLVRWMTSYDGQTAIAKAGYVTLEDIGFDYQEQRLSLWEGVGAGPAAQEPDSSEWKLIYASTTEWGVDLYEYLPLDYTDGVPKITWLADAKLTEEVNAFLAEQMEWVDETRRELEAWVAVQNRGEEYGQYSLTLPWEVFNVMPEGSPYACFVTAKNGYLSVAVSVCGSNNRMGSAAMPYRTETATWDLLTGKRLSVEELFCKGADMDQVLNEVVRRYAMSPMDEWGEYPAMKQEFAGLPETGWHLTHDAIYIDHANPYFVTAERIPLENLPDGILVTEQARDFQAAVDHPDLTVCRNWRVSDRDNYYLPNSDGLTSCGFLKEEIHPNSGKINAEVMEYLNTRYTQAAIVDFYESKGVDIRDVEIWMLDWDLWNLGGKYLLFQGGAPHHMTDDENDRIVYPYPTMFLYDLETGEQVDWEVLVRENWREAVDTAWRSPGYVDVPLPEGEMICEHIYPQMDGTLDVTLADGNVRYSFGVPWDYVNFD